MAKIEIYETENDVKREDLKRVARRAHAMVDIGLMPGTMFTAYGLFDILFEKIGLTKGVRESKFGKSIDKFMEKYSPIPKPVDQWVEKHGRAAGFSIGGMFLLLGAIGLWKLRQTDKELEKLDKEDRHTIIPNNLSSEALGQIPIGPVGEFELHKVSPEKMKSYTDLLKQQECAEPALRLQ